MKLLTGYARPVLALGVAPGGNLLSAARKMSHVWEWDVSSGKVVTKHAPPRSAGRAAWDVLAVSPTGRYFVTLQDEFVVARWPLDGKPPCTVNLDGDLGPNPAVAVHPTRALFAVSSRLFLSRAYSYGYQLVESGTGRRGDRVKVGKEPVVALAFSPDGSHLAVASKDGRVHLFEVASGKRVASAEPKATPTRLAVNPATGDFAVACGKAVEALRGSDLSQVAEFKAHDVVVRAAAYSPDGKYLATAASDGVVALRDAATYDLAGRRHLDIGEISCLCWSGDSAKLYAGGNKVIAECDLADLVGQDRRRPKNIEPLSLAGHKRRVNLLAYSPDGRTLYSGDGRELFAWDMSGGAGQAKRREGFSPPSDVTQVSASPDGGRLALSFAAQTSVNDAATGATIRDLTRRGGFAPAAFFAPTGELYLRTSDAGRGVLEYRDAETDAVASSARLTFEGFGYEASATRPAFAGRVVYATWGGRAVVRWDRDAGEPAVVVTSPKVVPYIDVSPDGRRLATAAAADVLIHDLADGGKPRRLKHPLKLAGLGFAPDGRLVTASADGVVRVWDVVRGAELFAFELGMGRIYSLAVSPDGMTFAAGVHKRKSVVLMDVPE